MPKHDPALVQPPGSHVDSVEAYTVRTDGLLDDGTTNFVEQDHVLMIARFPDLETAKYVYGDLREAEEERSLHIDGVCVVKADKKGKIQIEQMTEHSTRTGLRWGAVGGAVAAIVFPVGLIGGAVVAGIAGATAGKARNLTTRAKVAKELEGVIIPGACGILCFVSEDDERATAAIFGPQLIRRIPVDAETAHEVKVALAVESAPGVKPA